MTNIKNNSMLVFSLDTQRYALPYPIISRVIRAIEISPLPNASRGVLGLINVHGNLIPTIDIRYYLGLEPRDLQIKDYIVIIEFNGRFIAFVTEDVFFADFPNSAISSTEVLINNIVTFDKMIKDRLGIIYILNTEKILESFALQNIPYEQALKKAGGKK